VITGILLFWVLIKPDVSFSWSVSDFIPNETSYFLVVGGETRMALIVRLSFCMGLHRNG
jgi:hypothetical protein